jgi:hypothetical protein
MPLIKEETKLYQRQISRVTTVPKPAPGFVGPGHLAAPVIPSDDFVLTDPFVALMDDHLDIGNRPVGGPHPHAGFETITLLFEEKPDRSQTIKNEAKTPALHKTVTILGIVISRQLACGRGAVAPIMRESYVQIRNSGSLVGCFRM